VRKTGDVLAGLILSHAVPLLGWLLCCTPRAPSAAWLRHRPALGQLLGPSTWSRAARILRASSGYSPSESTLLRLFHRRELIGPAAGGGVVFGRFETTEPNEPWVGDALHGPRVGGRKTYLFAFLDDLFPAGDRLPVRFRRVHRAPGRRAGTGAVLPRRASGLLRRQRIRLR
jgi:hypothetical protein